MTSLFRSQIPAMKLYHWLVGFMLLLSTGVAIATPTIIDPVGGSALGGASVSINWTTDVNANQNERYWIYAGTQPGDRSYYNSGNIPAGTTTAVVSSLPMDGSPVYVTLWYKEPTTSWSYVYQIYDAYYSAPSITSPVPGSTLNSVKKTFTWEWSDSSEETQYWLYIGSATGAYDYVSSGSITYSLSYTTNKLPDNGDTIYVRLWYINSATGGWKYIDSEYVAVSEIITSPIPGSTLNGSSPTFNWSSQGNNISYWLYGGDQVGSNSYFDSGNLAGSLSYSANNLPTSTVPIHIRLWFIEPGLGAGWSYFDYEYTGGPYTAVQPDIHTPVPGSTLGGAEQEFYWSTGAFNEFSLKAGSSIGAADYFNSGNLGNTSFYPVYTLPTNGEQIHVTLGYRLSALGSWNYTYYQYTAYETIEPVLISPDFGGILVTEYPGSSKEFVWNTSGHSLFRISIGSETNSTAHYNSGVLSNVSSHTATNLPYVNNDVYLYLWFYDNGWKNVRYHYTGMQMELF